TPASQVAAVLRGGSPGFPRRHSNPDDYLRRTTRPRRRRDRSLSFSRARSPPIWSHRCSRLVIAPLPARACVEDSYRNPCRAGFHVGHQRTFKLRRRSIVQSRMQPLLVIDFLQKLADGLPRVRQIAIFGSVYFFVFEVFM